MSDIDREGGYGYIPPPGADRGVAPSDAPPPVPPPDADPGVPPPDAPPPPSRSAWDAVKDTFDVAPITVILIAVTVGAWLGHEALQHIANINTDLTLGDPELAIHGDWWRLVTPMLVHFGILHLGLNMLVLWRLGPPVERVVGSRLFLASYLLSGIGGQVVSDMFTKAVVAPDGSSVWPLSGGASGAIFGVIGVLVGYWAATRLAERLGRQQLSGWRFNPKAVASLAIQGLVWLIIGGPLFHVDSAAHAGGGLVGLVIGAGVGWSRTRRLTPLE